MRLNKLEELISLIYYKTQNSWLHLNFSLGKFSVL